MGDAAAAAAAASSALPQTSIIFSSRRTSVNRFLYALRTAS
jgi:hypothetical protein